MGKVSSCKVKVNKESKLLNACTSRLDSVVGVLNVKSYSCDTLPSQVLVRKMEHESTVGVNSLLLNSSN